MGLFAAIIPGPILLSGIASILSNNTKGLFQAIRLVLIAAFVEFFIAGGIVQFGSWLQFAKWFFVGLAIVGAGLLVYLAMQLWKAQNTKIEAIDVSISPWQMVGITVFNPMLWSLWTSVSMPLAVETGKSIWIGEWWYIVCFLGGVVIGHSFIFGLVEIIKEKFLSPHYTKTLFQVVAIGFLVFAVIVLWNGWGLMKG